MQPGWLAPANLMSKKARVEKRFAGFIFALLVASTLGHPYTVAQSAAAQLPKAPGQIQVPIESAQPSQSFMLKMITANHFNYLSSNSQNFREGAATTMPSFDFRLLSQASQSGAGGLDIETRFNANEEAVYFRPMELYAQINLDGDQKVFIGRKKLPWSRSDQLWRRGLFEPRHMDDPIEARRAGLLGAFYTQQSGDTRIFAFASPLFIPEFGPQQSLSGGQFVSRNPWFQPPPAQVQLQNGIADLNYQLDQPDILATVTNSGGGFGLRQSFGSSVFVESSYLYKPMNQIALGFPFVVELGNEGETTSVDVEVNARVSYHHLANFAVGKEFSDGSVIYSELIFERPEDNTPPRTWIAKQNGAASILNVTLEKSFRTITNPNRKLWLSFSNVNGGDVRDSGNFSGEQSLFERRYQFQQSVAAGWQGRWFRLGKVIVSNISRGLYDLRQRGYLLSSEFDLRFSRSLSGLLRFDTLGNFSLDGEVEDGFLSRYRANDRASVGVRYVF
ncbi:MAG: hypothetical protein HRT45_14145 [Bdellovibrionales bacterium]|nr:hypothetical protein [Bdellovibrionales bacterium]